MATSSSGPKRKQAKPQVQAKVRQLQDRAQSKVIRPPKRIGRKG